MPIGPTATLVQRSRTDAALLIEVIEDGHVLRFSGDDARLEIAWSVLEAVADEADRMRHGPVARHAHIEYLGEGDVRRCPDSVPLVVTAAWPERS